ncbi:3-oxoacyl-ACP synthase III family protein [Allosalinactinospora lopnorensis]|uniref:3-oxoacyl-ACP synthase III family protein n=1 Tax=Allosalinactinospora lopnorensis TaxID=1352348 RepID=UPI000623DC22|nr:ketoacyl-ACP synthase III [Allosalinactinospora lopnorensis]
MSPIHPNGGVPVVLEGVGHDFPGEPVPNSFFETELPHLGINDAWIREHTGVHTRHWPKAGEHHVDMAERAAAQALRDARLDPGDVDVIIGTSATARPRVNPTTAGNRYMDVAQPLQHRLGASRAFSFDVTAVACSGFLHTSVVARAVLSTMNVQTVLVVCAENPRPILNFGYRNAALFGAGAAAGVWRRASGPTGLHGVTLRTEPRYYDAFDIDDDDKMLMKGKVVGDVAPRFLAEVTTDVLLGSGLGWLDLDWIIPHQGNIHIIEDFQKAMDAPKECVLVNIDRRGNTSSVSVPGCLSENVHNGVIRSGQRILAASIGRGFSGGAMIFSYGEPGR